ncbi:cytochrome P450 (plasmid) [Rhodococcus rhodochrous]|nr:cytochrome P450 [Rhodococcus rhodochrous]
MSTQTVSPVPAPTADWLDPVAMLEDPHPTYERLRALGPVVWAPAINRYLAVSHSANSVVEADSQTYSANVTGAAALMARTMGARPLLRKDDPEHANERRPINSSMRPKNIREVWVAMFERNAETYLDHLIERGPEHADLNTDYAAPLAAQNLADMLGLTGASPQQMQRWSQAFIDGISNLSNDSRVWERADAAQAEVDALLDQLIPYYAQHPNTSMISAWVNGGLPEASIRANIKLTISGGMNEPQHMVTNMVWALDRHPAQHSEVLTNAALWPTVFEETVRWLSPIGMLPRETTRPTVLEGTEIPAGASVGGLLACANRDPNVFERPNDFDIHRPKRPHLAFGAGSHLCAGQWAARISIGEIAVPRLYQRLPEVRLDERRSEQWFGWVFRGLSRMPVTW